MTNIKWILPLVWKVLHYDLTVGTKNVWEADENQLQFAKMHSATNIM
jgi:tryptophan-rich sensory protein